MELRPYQQQAKDAIFSEWENGIKKTLLVLPTGCGKTIVFVLSGKLIAAPNCKLKQTFWNQPLLKQSHCLLVIQHDI